VDIIHSSYYINCPWVNEINFCRFICVMNDGPYTCYKTKVFFNIYICSFSTILYAISISDTCLRSRKSISKPNFDKISQSTACSWKRMAAILDFHFWFLFWRMCSHRSFILHLSSKFRRDRKIGGGVMTSYRFFKMAA